MNKKVSSEEMASLASEVLRDKGASKVQKTLAGSVLSQAASGKETGADMEALVILPKRSSVYG